MRFAPLNGLKYLVLLAALLCAPAHATPDGAAPRPDRFAVTAPPADWKLAPFYKKHVSAGGLPVLGSAKVSDHSLREAAYLITQMLAERPDILQALIKNKVRFAVMAPTELTTIIPE